MGRLFYFFLDCECIASCDAKHGFVVIPVTKIAHDTCHFIHNSCLRVWLLCVCVCVCKYMHTYVFLSSPSVSLYLSIRPSVRVYVGMRACMQVYVRKYYVFGCVCVYLPLPMCVCVCV